MSSQVYLRHHFCSMYLKLPLSGFTKYVNVGTFNVFLSHIGVVNMSFPLSDQPVFGEWFIFVEVQGHTYNKSFEVRKYGKDPADTSYFFAWYIKTLFHI